MYSAQHLLSEIPTADFLLIEEHLEHARDHVEATRPEKPRAAKPAPRAVARHYFFHSLIGRAANDALARVVSWRLSKLHGGNAVATPHDYGFVLTVTPAQKFSEAEVPELLRPERFEEELHAALSESEMVKFHFRMAAQTGLMVYRNYFDERKPVRKVQWSTEVIFNVLQQHEPNHVLLREARRETLHTYVDVDGARAWVEGTPTRAREAAQSRGGATAELCDVCHQNQRSAAGGEPHRYDGAVVPPLVEPNRGSQRAGDGGGAGLGEIRRTAATRSSARSPTSPLPLPPAPDEDSRPARRASILRSRTRT